MSECPPHQPLCQADPYATYDIAAKIPNGECDMPPSMVESWWCRKCGCLFLVSLEFDEHGEVRRPLVDGKWGAPWHTAPVLSAGREHGIGVLQPWKWPEPEPEPEPEKEVIVGYEERAEVEVETKKICAEAEHLRAEVEALKVKAEITRMECEDGHQALAMINQDSVQCREHEVSLARLRQRPTLFLICVGGVTILGLALLWGILA